MNECWNLDPIYKGFEDPAFREDLETLSRLVEEMDANWQAMKEAVQL